MTSRGTGLHHGPDKACPKPSYACFESTRVLVCGYPDEEFKDIKATIEANGGKVYAKFGRLHLPQVIICGSAGDKTYKDCRKQIRGGEVPAVTKQWVEDCNRAQGQVPYAKYELKAFTGLTISITNFSQAQKNIIQSLIQQAGGLYSAGLYKGKCSHLICKTASGDKYRAARQWEAASEPHPHLVNEAWIHASIKLGYPAPEEDYLVSAEECLAAAASVPAAINAAAATAGSAAAALSVLPSIQGGVNDSNDSWIAATSSGGTAATTPSGQQQQQHKHSSAATTAAAAIGARATRAKSAAAAAAAEPSMQLRDHQQLQLQQQQVQQPHSAEPGVALADKYAPLYDRGLVFLERVQLWWCGISISEQPELRHMLFGFGGVWMPKLNDNITHIMIGCQATSAELLEVKQYLQSCQHRIEVVKPDWLHFCMTEQQLVTDDRGRLPLAGLLNLAALGPAAPVNASGAAAAVAPAGNVLGGVFSQPASRAGFPEREWEPNYWLHRPRNGAKVFEGCHFTLAALKGQPEEQQKALEKIRQHGGQEFSHGSTKPPASCPTVFAVCPVSLAPANEQQLTAADSSFRAVHTSCRVTVPWLVACVEIDMHTPLFAPIRHTLPLADFASVSVAISGYVGEKRDTIARLAQLLGAKVIGVLTKKNVPSHLIIPRRGPDATTSTAAAADPEELADSQIKKIRFAQKYAVKMVDSSWLLECVTAGKQVSLDEYRPKGDVPQLQAAAAAGGTQSNLSQLTQTQCQQAATKAPAAMKHDPTNTRKCPMPSCRAATGGGGETVDGREDVPGNSSRPSNWVMAGASRPSQQQQQLQPSSQQQNRQHQQQQHKQGEGAGPRLRKTVRRLPQSPEERNPAKEGVPGTADQLQQRQHGSQDQRQQPDQQQEGEAEVASVAVARSTIAGAALADVGNKLLSSPPEQGSKAVDHLAPVVSGAVGTTTAGVQPAVAVAAAMQVSTVKVGLDGDEDPTLSTIMSALGQMTSRHDLVEGSYASQAHAQMPSLQQLSGRVGSGGPAVPASGGGSGGGGSGAGGRKKRKAVGGSSGPGDGKGSGSGNAGLVGSDPIDGSQGQAPAAVVRPAGEAKRPRRSSTTAAAAAGGAMPPPPARSAGKAALQHSVAGARGTGGSRYCPKKGSVTVQESMQMSQQVDYDIGQQPEALLAAAGRRKGHSAAADVKAKSTMLARLGQLNK